MKKYKKILFLFLIIVVTILGIFLYTTVSKGNSGDEKEKTLAEVEYLEKKIVTLLNELNNIESRNYNLSVSEISEEDSSQSGQSSSEQESKSSGEEESQGESNQNSQGQGENSSGNSNTDSSSGEQEKNEEYTLKETGVLTNTHDINWEHLKTEVENLYSPVPTITLDLYSLEIAKEDILGFNQELDNLTTSVKEENKENVLGNLSRLYEYIPKFADKVTDDTTYKNRS